MAIITNRVGATTDSLMRRRKTAPCWNCGTEMTLLTLDANGSPICGNCMRPERAAPLQQPDPESEPADGG